MMLVLISALVANRRPRFAAKRPPHFALPSDLATTEQLVNSAYADNPETLAMLQNGAVNRGAD